MRVAKLGGPPCEAQSMIPPVARSVVLLQAAKVMFVTEASIPSLFYKVTIVFFVLSFFWLFKFYFMIRSVLFHFGWAYFRPGFFVVGRLKSFHFYYLIVYMSVKYVDDDT